MCNVSDISMYALSHMCMLFHTQKCPVTLIINPVPLLVCKEKDSYPSYSHNYETRYTWVPIVCVFSSVEQFCQTPDVSAASSHSAVPLDAAGLSFRVKREVWWNSNTLWMLAKVAATRSHHSLGNSVRNFPHLFASPSAPRSQPEHP